LPAPQIFGVLPEVGRDTSSSRTDGRRSWAWWPLPATPCGETERAHRAGLYIGVGSAIVWMGDTRVARKTRIPSEPW